MTNNAKTGNIKRIVVKIGTSVLLDKENHVSIGKIEKIAKQVKVLKDKGIEVAIVSSGAVACGMETLNLKKRPVEIEKKQALASIGQVSLMKMYKETFERAWMKVGQILLTHEDIKSKTKCLNLMNTMNTLLAMDIVPVINENDALSFKEIKFGDNDNLSALIAQLCCADLLLLLSDVEGLYEKDPNKYPMARMINVVPKIDADIERLAEGTKSEKSTGGMVSKLEAAKKAGFYGICTRIVHGDVQDCIIRTVGGEQIGTLFLPGKKLARSKWWTAFAFKPKGEVRVDEGAELAILHHGKSLLPSGITNMEGDFNRGECIEVVNALGDIIAKGITNYASSDILRIKGLKSADIERRLGYKYAEEVIHRDNMVII
ncbi:MAG: glutamate 5-kinase [Syntrophobacterales bacterium]|jgi:glutamate 5-kinase|nr:glutamate 5-kinase [Syntrophobacterales bacterium]